jgi:hypothetical protein
VKGDEAGEKDDEKEEAFGVGARCQVSGVRKQKAEVRREDQTAERGTTQRETGVGFQVPGLRIGE